MFSTSILTILHLKDHVLAKKEKKNSDIPNNGNGPNKPKKGPKSNFSNSNAPNNNPRRDNDSSLYEGDADVRVVGIKDNQRIE